MGCLIRRSLLRAEVCYEYFNSVMLVTYPRTAFDVFKPDQGQRRRRSVDRSKSLRCGMRIKIHPYK